MVGRSADRAQGRDLETRRARAEPRRGRWAVFLVTREAPCSEVARGGLSPGGRRPPPGVSAGTLPPFLLSHRYLIKFLAKLAQTSDVNKMTPSNIAIVLGPNLLWARNEG